MLLDQLEADADRIAHIQGGGTGCSSNRSSRCLLGGVLQSLSARPGKAAADCFHDMPALCDDATESMPSSNALALLVLWYANLCEGYYERCTQMGQGIETPDFPGAYFERLGDQTRVGLTGDVLEYDPGAPPLECGASCGQL